MAPAGPPVQAMVGAFEAIDRRGRNMSWMKRLAAKFQARAASARSRKRGTAPRGRRVTVEVLEDRRLLSVAAAAGDYDFGDLPDNYGTTLVADGARHAAVGPTLGATRDAEADGVPTTGADGDDTDNTGRRGRRHIRRGPSGAT